MPSGLYGARVANCPADATWRVMFSVDDHRRHNADFHLLAMDQKQCFDRLDLDQLHRVASATGMPSACLHALSLYGRLERHLFIDGQPTGYILSGDGIRGVPQGCPLACHFCNLTSWLWHLELQHHLPSVTGISFLDDRLVFTSGDLTLLDRVLDVTKVVDDYL